MIDSVSSLPRNRQARALSIPVFAISLFLAAIFISSCGDEGDTTEDPSRVTDVLQPATTTPATPLEDEEEKDSFKDDIQHEQEEDRDRNEQEEDRDRRRVSFKDDIQPILVERCAIPGCHVAPGAGGLDLTGYDTLKKGGNGGATFDAGKGKGSLIVKRINGGGMPPIPPPLDADQVQLFIDWINEGAENN